MSMHPNHTMVFNVNRRAFLRNVLGLGIGIPSALQVGSASAARRGQSSTLAGSGYAIAVIEGPIHGELETVIYRAAVGRAIVFSNFISVDIEVEVIRPDYGPSTDLLGSGWSLHMPIDHPGIVRWRVWRSGETPGNYQEIDFRG